MEYGGYSSIIYDVCSGVPQGSSLGPLLFVRNCITYYMMLLTVWAIAYFYVRWWAQDGQDY